MTLEISSNMLAMLPQAVFGATIIGLLGAAGLVYRNMPVFLFAIIGGAAASSSYILFLFDFNVWALFAAGLSWGAPFIAIFILVREHLDS